MKKAIVASIVLFISISSWSQKLTKPEDFLTNDFHKERRELVREKMPENSVAVFFANPVRNRANDVNYVYHQDPNF